MKQGPAFFQSKWYHLGMAAIYFIAGLILILYSYTAEDQFQAGIIGWVLCGYSIYRAVSRLRVLNKEGKDEK